jgi:hypothetical protein
MPGENRPNGENGQNGEHRPAMDTRPPHMESPRPYEGGGNYAVISSDFDDIDTTPTLEPRAYAEPVRRVADNEALPDEVDTTPQPIERPKDHAARADEESAAPQHPTAEEDNDPNRPKRSGWWQRKSFF